MRCAVFLDRDGVINREVSYICDPAEIVLIPGASAGIRLLNERGYLVVVISNQSAVARGLCSLEEIHTVNERLIALLAAESAVIDGMYVCPHHPGVGIEGGNPAFIGECECRKPRTGLIEQAEQDFAIDRSQSFFIGDSGRDIECGKRANLKTIRVRTGHPILDTDIGADFTVTDLFEAANLIAGLHS